MTAIRVKGLLFTRTFKNARVERRGGALHVIGSGNKTLKIYRIWRGVKGLAI